MGLDNRTSHPGGILRTLGAREVMHGVGILAPRESNSQLCSPWNSIGVALVVRGVMIAFGARLITRYHWLLYLFGALLIATAVEMLVVREDRTPRKTSS